MTAALDLYIHHRNGEALDYAHRQIGGRLATLPDPDQARHLEHIARDMLYELDPFMSDLAEVAWTLRRARYTRCSSCGALMVWARTRNGKRIPIDPDPIIGGNLVYIDIDTVLTVGGLLDDPQALTFISHFASCPDANTHRRRT